MSERVLDKSMKCFFQAFTAVTLLQKVAGTSNKTQN